MIYAIAFAQIVVLLMVVALVRAARVQQASLAALEAIAYGRAAPPSRRGTRSEDAGDQAASVRVENPQPAPFWPVEQPYFFRPDDSRPGGLYLPEHLEGLAEEIAEEQRQVAEERARLLAEEDDGE